MNCLIEKVLNNNNILSRAWKDTRRNIDRYVLHNSHKLLFSREQYRDFLSNLDSQEISQNIPNSKFDQKCFDITNDLISSSEDEIIRVGIKRIFNHPYIIEIRQVYFVLGILGANGVNKNIQRRICEFV